MAYLVGLYKDVNNYVYKMKLLVFIIKKNWYSLACDGGTHTYLDGQNEKDNLLEQNVVNHNIKTDLVFSCIVVN
jgi:hypothetical protein